MTLPEDLPKYTIVEDGLTGEPIIALLRYHLEQMHRWSPACKVHAMPVERLRQPDVTFFSAWRGDELAACGALKQLDPQHGELKSMRAAPAFLGKGAGEAILMHLMDEARRRNYHWIGLETGRSEAFLPAHSLYRKHGFAECEPFADYVSDDFSLCMSLTIGN